MPGNPSDTLLYGFISLLIVTCIGALVLVHVSGRRGHAAMGKPVNLGWVVIGLAVWLLFGAGVSLSGVTTAMHKTPAPVIYVLVPMVIGSFAVTYSRLGKQLAVGLPLTALIAFQGFRFPLELLLHQAYVDGVMPVQMSFSGLNFDIVSGVSAIIIGVGYALLRRQVPYWLAWVFNLVGMGLLITIVGIAIASMPMIAAFGDDTSNLNVWVGYFPYVWLPAVFVAFALVGHLLIARKLLTEGKSSV